MFMKFSPSFLPMSLSPGLTLGMIMGLVLALAIILALPARSLAATPPLAPNDDKALLAQTVQDYCDSVTHADNPALAEKVWVHSPQATLIHPRGHEVGWDAVRQNFYTKTMAGLFSKRKLEAADTPAIMIYGDTAVVEFYWNFTATVKETGAERQTSGRESQVYIKQKDNSWRLAHVHYSAPPQPAS